MQWIVTECNYYSENKLLTDYCCSSYCCSAVIGPNVCSPPCLTLILISIWWHSSFPYYPTVLSTISRFQAQENVVAEEKIIHFIHSPKSVFEFSVLQFTSFLYNYHKDHLLPSVDASSNRTIIATENVQLQYKGQTNLEEIRLWDGA